MIETENPPSVTLASFQLPTGSGAATIEIKTGDAFMVAGPNGAGKSALLYTIYRAIGAGRSEYYPGHRQITFNNGWDNLAQDIDQMRTNMFTNVDIFNRYKNHWAEDYFKSVVRRLANADAAYNSSLVSLIDDDAEKAVLRKKKFPGPIETLNRVFQSARMAVRFKASGRGLRVIRGPVEYDIDQLSDGERAALFIAGAVIVQEPYSVIAIDEPERNLHPSIAAPLVNSLMIARPDIAFLFASHDVNLIAGTNIDRILYVQNSTVVSTRPEMRTFDVQIISGLENVDESIRRDLLGSRQKLLFIEGTTNSIDFQIYNSLFPDWKIAPKGGAQEVINAVKTLNSNDELHWVEVAGLIDRDGRNDKEISALQSENIFALKCPTCENLLFLPDVVEAVAECLFETEGGSEVSSRIGFAELALIEALEQSRTEISARLGAWRINQILSESKVSVADLRSGKNVNNEFNFSDIISSTNEEVDSLCKQVSSLKTLPKIPMKNTIIGSRIAGAIGADIKKYQSIIYRQLQIGSVFGTKIRNQMLKFLPEIALDQ